GEHAAPDDHRQRRLLLAQRDHPADQHATQQDQQDRAGASHNAPLVLGTPDPPRGSTATASRRARATALNWASLTWWAVAAAAGRIETGSVIRAAWPTDSHTCRVIEVG